MYATHGFRKFEIVDPASLPKNGANHEFLQGGQGKAVNYRQQRYRVGDLLNEVEHAGPRVVSDQFEGDLVDFAITGASCLCEEQTDIPAGAVVPKVWVMIGDETYYNGRARVVHVTPGVGRDNGCTTLVGLQLLDGIIDADRVLRFQSETEAGREMRKTRVILARTDISEGYKRSVADFLYILLRYRSLLSGQEEELTRVSHAARNEMEREILESTWQEFSATIAPVQTQLEEMTMGSYYDREFQELHRAYTMPLVTPHVVCAPILYRSWAKPLGFAGDHVTMDYIYEREWVGETLFAKLMHRYGTEHPASETVRARKVFLKKLISQAAFESDGRADDELRNVVTLGCGPAREMVEFAQEYEGSRSLQFTLIDQDNGALGMANKQLSPLVMSGDSRIGAQYLYVAFAQLIRDAELFGNVPPANLLYCSGLFDYVSTGKAKLLISRLFDKVAPGGRIVIGNFSAPAVSSWTQTYLLDWNLRYRTREEMEELLSELQDDMCEGEVVEDGSGRCYFIVARRRVR